MKIQADCGDGRALCLAMEARQSQTAVGQVNDTNEYVKKYTRMPSSYASEFAVKLIVFVS